MGSRVARANSAASSRAVAATPGRVTGSTCPPGSGGINVRVVTHSVAMARLPQIPIRHSQPGGWGRRARMPASHSCQVAAMAKKMP